MSKKNFGFSKSKRHVYAISDRGVEYCKTCHEDEQKEKK